MPRGLTWVGSYNLHPRSARYEIEKAMVSLNVNLNKALTENFNKTIQDPTMAQEILRVQELSTPQNPGMDFLFNNVIFNQL